MKKKILIIGNSVNTAGLAKSLAKNNTIFVAPGNDSIKDFATCVDIREDAITELLEFVLENDIELTIPISQYSLNTNIVELFTKNNQQIFAPNLEVTNNIFNKFAVKKLLYKLRIPTPKFGIFEKQAMAIDYIKNFTSPYVIKTNEQSSSIILTTQRTAKNMIESLFKEKNQKVLIEDYIWGTSFAFYVISDGYKALPIGSSILYNHSLEGDGGQLTDGMGACSPNYKLTIDNEYYLMDKVVYPILETLERNGNPYLGILGVQGIITDTGSLQILGFKPFMQDVDCTAILELLDVNILNLIESCIIGSFSDEFDYIPQKNMSATALVLKCNNKNNQENIIEGLENIDENIKVSFYPQIKKNKYLEYETNYGNALILTSIARTLTSSTKLVYQEAQNVNFKGITYRKDICRTFDRN
jgi:phosphoribosylamine--glycine ligase